GEHHCLVFPVLRPALRNDVCDVMKALSGPTRYKMCCQIASAISFLHGHGIYHGGKKFSLSLARLFQVLGPTRFKKLRWHKQPDGSRSRSPHPPKVLIELARFSGLDFSLLANVRITDFGEALFADRPPSGLGVPIDSFPPELCFGYLPSTESDVWELATLLY
ncbi:hypothetical protein B0T26DRAFT_621831, partial [Lasiosphaeria miniovina]